LNNFHISGASRPHRSAPKTVERIDYTLIKEEQKHFTSYVYIVFMYLGLLHEKDED